MNIKLKKLSNQDGLVSIVVTLFVMSILTLIAVGFANSANREQRQALDQQLSTQAFYAAESGINEVIKAGGVATTTECEDPEQLGSDESVATTCVIVDDEPLSDLQADVTTNESSLLQIEPSAPLQTLTIGWQDKGGSEYFAPNCDNSLKNSSDWATFGGASASDPNPSTTGVIRAMLIPRTGFASRAELVAKTHTFLLYPSVDGCGVDSVSVVKAGSAPNTKGGFLNGKCNTTKTPRYCSVSIRFTAADGTTPDPILPSEQYVLRLKSIYRTSAAFVTGQDTGGSTISFVHGQKEIESAGKANDVLRTVKVRIPYTTTVYSGAIYPESAIETENAFCKLIEIYADSSGGRSARSTDSSPACAGPTP